LFVRQWSLSDLTPISSNDLLNRDLKRGRQLFAAVSCFECHRISLDGGVLGPDLTAVGRRLSPFDLLETIIAPNKIISDQYAATTVVTNDGTIITGRIVNIMREQIMIQTDMLQPAKLIGIPQREIAEMRASSTSMMPSGLLDTLSRDEIMDLLAFVLSGR
jgi:putative heme-binding domain-containing protein